MVTLVMGVFTRLVDLILVSIVIITPDYFID